MNDSSSAPLVTVICTTYNHEKYIRKCLDGIVMQKTTFPFEVLVHDDASTDHTAEIIREYADRYPWLIKPILQTENQYSKLGFFVFDKYVYPIARGKYCAICEGDDYWADPEKLQKQFEALESHPDCKMCVGRVNTVTEDGLPGASVFPKQQIPTGAISDTAFLKLAFANSFHTSSFFFTTDGVRKLIAEMPEFKKRSPVGDEIYLLYFGQLGPIFYIDEVLSVYRMNSVGGWSAANRSSAVAKQVEHQEKMIRVYRLFDEYTQQKYHDVCQTGIRRRAFEILRIKGDYKAQLSEEYQDIFSRLPRSYQRKVKLAALFPRTARAIQNRRRQK